MIQDYLRPWAASRINSKPAHKLLPQRERHDIISRVRNANPTTHPTLPFTVTNREQEKRMCRRTPTKDSGHGASCCAPAKQSQYEYLSLAETGGAQNNHLSRRKYMQDVLVAERRFQRVRTMEQDGADGGGFPRRHSKTLPPSDLFSIWENKGWPPPSGRLSQLKGWPP